MDNQKVLFYFLIVFLTLLFITTFSNIYNNKVNEITEGFTSSSTTTNGETTAAETTAAETTAAETTAAEISSQLSEHIQEYIDKRLESEAEALNRIRDTDSRLENIGERLNMVDDTYEKVDEISQSYKTFHNNYQTKLEEILKKKFDTNTNKYSVNNRIHAMRLEKIKEDLEQLDELKKSVEQTDESSSNATSRGQSLRAMSDGSRLNFEYVVLNGERTNKIIISLNNGCLAFGEELDNGRSIMSLNLNCAEKRNSPTLHFEIHTINNNTEYNAKINYDNDGTKTLVSDEDNIAYPFKLVSPTLHYGHCVDLVDGIVKIIPCTKDISQRFKISNSQVLGECPQEASA